MTSIVTPSQSFYKTAAIVIWIGSIAVLIIIVGINILPYSQFTKIAVQQGFARWPFIGWAFKIDWVASLLGLIFGTSAFLAIQLGEVLPLLRNRRDAIARKMELISLVSFIIDSICCLTFWPPFKVSLAQIQIAFSWGQINYQNVIIIFLTIFGGTLFVLLSNTLKQIHSASS
jgi:hypothetical protein